MSYFRQPPGSGTSPTSIGGEWPSAHFAGLLQSRHTGRWSWLQRSLSSFPPMTLGKVFSCHEALLAVLLPSSPRSRGKRTYLVVRSLCISPKTLSLRAREHSWGEGDSGSVVKASFPTARTMAPAPQSCPQGCSSTAESWLLDSSELSGPLETSS